MKFRTGVVAKNSIAVFFTKVIELLSGILVIMLLTRYLGKEAFGEYSFIMGFILLRFLIDFGIDPIFFREISRDRNAARALLNPVFAFKGILSLITLLLVVFTLLLLNIPLLSKVGILLTVLSQIPVSYSFSFFSIFRGYERMEYETFVTLIYRSFFILLTALFVILKLKFLYIFIFLLVSEIFRFILSFVMTATRFIRFGKGVDWKRIPYIAGEGLPLAITAFFSTGVMKLGIFLIKFLRDPAVANNEIALFQVPNVVIWQINFLPVAISTAIFPVFSRLFRESRRDVKGLFENTFRLYSLFAWWAVTVIIFFSREAVLILSGHGFLESAANLKVMVFALPFLFFEQLGSMLLIAAGRQALVLITTISCFITYLLAGLLLTSWNGDFGCALSVLLAFIVQFSLSFHFVSRELGGLSPFRPFLLPMISSAVPLLLLASTGMENLFLRGGVAILLYPLLNLLFRSFDRRDIEFLARTLRRRNDMEEGAED